MFKKINYDNFILNRRGAVIVEFAFVAFIITLLIKVLITVATYQATVGKLDRISYSIAGIVRERERLYGSNSPLSAAQYNELKDLANKILLDSGVPNTKLKMTIERLNFRSATGLKIIDVNNSPIYTVGGCEPTRPLREMMELSPYSNSGQWLPLYQVTLCLPTAPWYNTLFSRGGTAIPIKSSAVTIER
ncbi:pseudopilin [Yersinia mollaretii]|uniref:Pseudopilin n=1 Tax=Yersinia mollaretii TaxID=33060 RepID=A0AA44CKP8_YERMO|nr:tight adherence pilus pseudopilin TadF [Yersinia mollaretii]NIL22564.1 pseudopilin [Yersinia mollaretii]CNI71745.1 putative tight adherance operon protein [Yersinia mollaretii]CNK65380.1 putative tight adherance operon protein [Yersinia enterocolitica]CQQ69900.1 putative tight adherance operon protein [Yersinia mollaretii]